MISKENVNSLRNKYKSGEKLSMLTAYDCSCAKYIDEAGVDMILVGDSAAMVILGYDSTCKIGIDEMKVFTSAVCRGAKRTFVVADMPFLACTSDISASVKNAGELIKCGAGAVKIEGASKTVLEIISQSVDCGIPVMAHLGFTPQFLNTIGGYNIQGKSCAATLKLLDEALKVQAAGAFAVVLEMVPEESAKFITEKLDIPTIGIGAGRYTSGQVLVSDDILGKFSDFKPTFVRRYADLKSIITEAAKKYSDDVKIGNFPSEAEIFKLSAQESELLENHIGALNVN